MISPSGFAQDADNQDDIDLLLSEFPDEGQSDAEDSDDDLQSLKDDLGEIDFNLPEDESNQEKQAKEVESLSKDEKQIEKVKREIDPESEFNLVEKNEIKKKLKIVQDDAVSDEAQMIFEVGKAEKELLEMAQGMQGKIPDSDWERNSWKIYCWNL